MAFEPQFATLSPEEALPRFVVLHLPPDGRAPKGLVVHAPAFAEEMNKARRMVALQARALAEDGFAVLVLDPLGTGDSPGDFGDATWDLWISDAVSAMGWLEKIVERKWPGAHALRRVFWGLRTGALLATAAAARSALPADLLWWQPVVKGRSALQQFLRLLSAAELLGGRSQGEAATARTALAAGETVEVAGYRLSPGLASGLEAAGLDPPTQGGRLAVFELSTREDASVTPALGQLLQRWSAAGWQAQAQVVKGPSFWQTTEIEDVPALLEATRAALAPPGPLGVPA